MREGLLYVVASLTPAVRTVEPIADAQVFSRVQQAEPLLDGLLRAMKAKGGQIVEFIFQQNSSWESICSIVLLEVNSNCNGYSENPRNTKELAQSK